MSKRKEEQTNINERPLKKKKEISPDKWNRQQVYDWTLQQSNIDKEEADIILKNKVNGETLITLTYDKLINKPYNMPGGPATSLFNAIQGLIPQSTETQPSQPEVTSFKGFLLTSQSLSENDPYFLYWSSLCKKKVETIDNILKFPAGVFLIDGNNKHCTLSDLYIRPCYVTFMQIVHQNMEEKLDTVITGTPGVGKSLLRNYFAYHLVNIDDDDLFIAFHHSPGSYQILLFARINGKLSVYLIDRNSIPHFPLPNKFFYFLDVSEGNSNEKVPHWPFVMFTSPNRNAYYELLKYQTSLYYMPIWTLDELVKAGALSFDNTIIENRFLKYGGNARVVLATENFYTQHEKRVKEIIETFKVENLNVLGKVVDDKSNDVPHSLLYLKAIQNFRNYKYTWASEYIADQIAQKLLDHILDAIENITYDMSASFGATVRGVLFERMAHLFLTNSTFSLPLRADSGNITGFKFFADKKTITRLSENAIKKDIKNNTTSRYVVPTSEYYTGIDSYCYPDRNSELILFQMKSSYNIKSPSENLKNFFKDILSNSQKDIKLIWVVPLTLFINFRIPLSYMNITFTDKKKKKRKIINYILPICSREKAEELISKT